MLRYIKYHHALFTSDEFYPLPPPFENKFQKDKQLVRLTFQSTSKTIVLLLEEIPAPSIGSYSELGLTNRESQVLFWIGQSKTDGEIGKILGISPRTVQKHIENIFNKLGVEMRPSAASKIL